MFGGPTPHLRCLDVHLSYLDDDATDLWTTNIFGHDSNPSFVPPLKRLTIGWPADAHSDGYAARDAAHLFRAVPASLRDMVVVIGWELKPGRGTRRLFNLVGALDAALQDRQQAVNLRRFELDLANLGPAGDQLCADRRIEALRSTCEARDVGCRLTVAGGAAA